MHPSVQQDYDRYVLPEYKLGSAPYWFCGNKMEWSAVEARAEAEPQFLRKLQLAEFEKKHPGERSWGYFAAIGTVAAVTTGALLGGPVVAILAGAGAVVPSMLLARVFPKIFIDKTADSARRIKNERLVMSNDIARSMGEERVQELLSEAQRQRESAFANGGRDLRPGEMAKIQKVCESLGFMLQDARAAAPKKDKPKI